MKKQLELYELVLLLKSASAGIETLERVDFYRDFLRTKGSQVLVKNHGTRSLAYPIKGFETATNVQFIFPGNGDLLKQVTTQVQRDDFVLRSLINKLADNEVEETLEMFNSN
jgi:ribosomal protein S6